MHSMSNSTNFRRHNINTNSTTTTSTGKTTGKTRASIFYFMHSNC